MRRSAKSNPSTIAKSGYHDNAVLSYPGDRRVRVSLPVAKGPTPPCASYAVPGKQAWPRSLILVMEIDAGPALHER
jgi:hypothetical protein